jgi:hypothetical protein
MKQYLPPPPLPPGSQTPDLPPATGTQPPAGAAPVVVETMQPVGPSGSAPAEPPVVHPPVTGPPPGVEPPHREYQPIRHYEIRAGWGGLNGILGVGAAYRFGFFAAALGTGTNRLTAGVSMGRPGVRGGWYVDVHAAWVATGFLGTQAIPGWGLGASGGWDWRPWPWLSCKAGLGLAYSTINAGGFRPFFADLSIGPVF